MEDPQLLQTSLVPQSQTTVILFAVFLVTAVVVGGIGFYLGSRQKIQPVVPSQIGCTMEAKICPDGSAVGRSGPNCEFAECLQNDDSF